MDVQTLMNQKYESLCKQLGDLQYKKEVFQEQAEAVSKQIAVVKEQIRALDIAVPEMKRIEASFKAKEAE